MSTNLFTIIGLGYVGLPLAQAAVAAGLSGHGLDSSEEVVADLKAGRSHVDDLTNHDVAAMCRGGFMPTTDPGVVTRSDVVVICVPTPLGAEGGPDLGPVRKATESVRDHLRPGTLVILESTTWPGTTDEVVRPILEESGLTAGINFHLAYSPERIDPGNPTYGVVNTPKVVGGLTEKCGDLAEAFYSRFVTTVVRAAGTREAEMAKLLENTYRQVNIAMVNEMAKFSHELEIDIWDVIKCASSKPFGFQPFYPGPGVGGHCIPIDPSYLSHRVQAKLGYPFRFVELAQEINRSMPQYVATRVIRVLNGLGKPVHGSKILLLGVTYKPGIADQRESPVLRLGEALLEMEADLAFYDPFVKQWNVKGQSLACVENLYGSMREADAVIHLQPHGDYSDALIRGVTTPILDTRGTLSGENVVSL